MRICVSALQVQTKAGKTFAGVGRQMYQILGQMATRDFGHTYEIFIRATTEIPAEWESCAWIRWHRIDGSSLLKRVWWEHFKLGFVAKKLKCDLLHGLFIQLPIWCSLPMISTIHDAFPRTMAETFPKRQQKILDTLTQHAARKSSLIFTGSQYSKQEICRVYGAKPEKIEVLDYGPGNSFRVLSEAELGAIDLGKHNLPSGRRIVTVSTLEPRKNMVGLIQAFELLREDPEFGDVSLVVIGARGWLDSSIVETVGPDPTAKGIYFLGYVEDIELNAILQTADLSATVSFQEGFGLPILEAMMVGTPVVCSNATSMPEVGGDCVAYCEPTNTESIAKSFASVLNDQEKVPIMVRCGRERAKRFTWENTFDQMMNAIERVGKR